MMMTTQTIQFLLALSYCLLYSKEKACTIPLLPRDDINTWIYPPPSPGGGSGISRSSSTGQNSHQNYYPKLIITGTELSEMNFRSANQSKQADKMVAYIEQYYEPLEYFHWVLLVWCLCIIVLGWVNVIPNGEDAKVIIILMVSFLVMNFDYFGSVTYSFI